ncbi:hypothetical protein O9G_000509 [Rozella allomycis CSF55]|uniref:SCA7 domain-containing protein n=1 Tax=Rozella allomycis (strain CSF55) TaxID=988480 RepID=A0A075B040_ROZAC|nr:hypothetical protein O9G_000509 [Rozella allomycis CSF55]|eukprot:EPZ34322.1 hypothetical protein O9G_000509 [Rozella allomycis CSF55]
MDLTTGLKEEDRLKEKINIEKELTKEINKFCVNRNDVAIGTYPLSLFDNAEDFRRIDLHFKRGENILDDIFTPSDRSSWLNYFPPEEKLEKDIKTKGVLVRCRKCNRPVFEKAHMQHKEICQGEKARSKIKTPVFQSRVSSVQNKSLNSNIEENTSMDAFEMKSKLKKRAPSKKELDLNKQCGVLLNASGARCTRSLTCKSHSATSKRAVQRDYDYDYLLNMHNTRQQMLKNQKAAGIEHATAVSNVANATCFLELDEPIVDLYEAVRGSCPSKIVDEPLPFSPYASVNAHILQSVFITFLPSLARPSIPKPRHMISKRLEQLDEHFPETSTPTTEKKRKKKTLNGKEKKKTKKLAADDLISIDE